LQVLEARNGLQMVVAIGGNERARDGPVGEETIIDDVEPLGLVAKVMLASCGRRGSIASVGVG